MKTLPTYANADLIAIVDPRLMFRKGLTETLAGLRRSSEIIDTESYQELEEKYPQRHPDIFFLSGSGFSDVDILNTTRRLRQNSPLCRIAVYDNRNSLEFLLPFFRDSIVGYLPENFDDKDLLSCLNTLDKGLHYISSDIAYQLITQKPLRQKEPIKPLSGLERKVAGCLIRGMSTSQIAETLDRRNSTISTVKSNIFKKARVYNVIDLATTLKQEAPMKTSGNIWP